MAKQIDNGNTVVIRVDARDYVDWNKSRALFSRFRWSFLTRLHPAGF